MLFMRFGLDHSTWIFQVNTGELIYLMLESLANEESKIFDDENLPETKEELEQQPRSDLVLLVVSFGYFQNFSRIFRN